MPAPDRRRSSGLNELKNADAYHAYRENTAFDSTGWALEDYVIAELLTRYGEETGCGTDVELESISGDPKDYAFLHGALDEAVSGGMRVAGGAKRAGS